MRLLALDLATRLGWAHGSTRGGDPISGVHQLPKTGDDVGQFIAAYSRWLSSMVEETKPELIVFEEPMVNTAGRSPIKTTLKLMGLCSETERFGFVRGIKYAQVHAGTWKKSFVGTGKVSKTMKPYPVIVACKRHGWVVTDDNEADALGIWVHSVRTMEPAGTQFDPLFRHADGARAAA